MMTALKLVAVISAALFSGAALYISVVEQPARLLVGAEVALDAFRAGFPRARALQASLALVGALSCAWVWRRGAGRAWLVAAGCLVSIVAFTVVAIAPVYSALLDPALNPSAPEARTLLTRWGQLHAVRTLLGLVALVSVAVSSVREST